MKCPPSERQVEWDNDEKHRDLVPKKEINSFTWFHFQSQGARHGVEPILLREIQYGCPQKLGWKPKSIGIVIIFSIAILGGSLFQTHPTRDSRSHSMMRKAQPAFTHLMW